MSDLYQKAAAEVRANGFISAATSFALQGAFVNVAKLERYLLERQQ
jgi:hypothetical protein